MKIVSLIRMNRTPRGPGAPADRGDLARRRLHSLWRLVGVGTSPLDEGAEARGDGASGGAGIDHVTVTTHG